jgi:hypothetical protein
MNSLAPRLRWPFLNARSIKLSGLRGSIEGYVTQTASLRQRNVLTMKSAPEHQPPWLKFDRGLWVQML